MPDPIDNPSNDPAGDGNDPKKTKPGEGQAFDTTKIGDDDFEKVFDDPRVWKHPRFASLKEKASKAGEYEAEKQKAEEKRLAEQKKFEELATLREKERDEWKGKHSQSQIDNRITLEASKTGVKSLEAVLKLIDRSKITVAEDGTVTGVEDAVKALLDKESYLKGTPGQVTIGSPTNPGADNPNAPKKFKLSQLQNSKFWQENEKEIQEALKNGLVEDDMAVGI